jgi:hypothetical protein
MIAKMVSRAARLSLCATAPARTAQITAPMSADHGAPISASDSKNTAGAGNAGRDAGRDEGRDERTESHFRGIAICGGHARERP